MLLLSCRETPQHRERLEAVSFARLLDQLREADNRGKAGVLALLREQACSAPAVCELKQTCVSAYEQQVSALSRLDGVRAQLEAPAAGLPAIPAPAASGAAYELALVEQALAQARAASDRCAELQAAIQQQYELR